MDDTHKTLVALVAIGAVLAIGTACLKYAAACGWIVSTTLRP